MIEDYRPGDTIQLLLRGTHAATVMTEWWETNRESDLRWRRAKTKGCAVLETTDLMFAARIVQWYEGVKVNIKHREP